MSEGGDQNYIGGLNNNDMSIGMSSVNYQSDADNSSMKSFGSAKKKRILPKPNQKSKFFK